MRMFKKITKVLLASFLAVTSLTVGAISTASVVEAAENESVAVEEYVPKFNDSITLSNAGGDHKVILQSLPEAIEFTYSADVELTNLDEQQSMALMFGIKDGNPDDAHAMKANIHNRIDWATPIRVWGYGLDEQRYGTNGTPTDVVDIAKKIHMEISVEKNSSNQYVFKYFLSNVGGTPVKVAETVLKDSYTGGKFGLMTYSSTAVFNNITLTTGGKTYKYGNYEKTSDGFVVNGLNGDAHLLMKDPDVIASDFVYETDVDLIAGSCVALTFGIKNPNNVGASWVGANFNFNDEGGNGRVRVFQVENGDPMICAATHDANGNTVSEVIQRNKTIHLKLEVTMEGEVTFTVKNKDDDEAIVASGSFANANLTYVPGNLGILCFDSSAKFTNTTIALGDSFELFNTTHYNNIGGTALTVDKTNDTVTVGNSGGDHFAMNALVGHTTDFFYEADVVFPNHSAGSLSAGLVFGTNSKTNPGQSWFAANTDTSGSELFRIFYVPGPVNHVVVRPNEVSVDYSKPVHFAIDMKNNGDFVYRFGNEGNLYERTGNINGWAGGYVGVLTFNEEAVFSNVHFVNRNKKVEIKENVLENDGSFKTNLTDLFTTNAFKDDWSITSDGLRSANEDEGDTFFFTKSSGKNFVYETDVTFASDKGAAALIFRSNNDLTNTNKESYGANFDIGSGEGKVWRWYRNGDIQLSPTKKVPRTEDNTYHLKVVAYNTWLLFYVNDVLVGSLGDYNVQSLTGQPTAISEGYFGMLNWNGDVTFQNTYYKEFTNEFNPVLADITVSSSTGTVEEKALFTTAEPTMLQYVKNDATTVNITTTSAFGSKIVVKDANGTVYPNGKNIPVAVGKNIITVESTDTLDGTTATAVYHVNVHRLKADEIYYNEAYRGQYHYSVKEGWANDPNGMVYYNGKYHLFYQFYDDTVWGPMHWAHAVSTDMIHWTDEPITFYPDANGTQFSGCMVVDENNTSGLFEGTTGGLVALITEDGNGQRVKVAYSSDEGKTWTKVDKIAADWTDDPLADGAFRDPKVFRWENKWFMVIAGGPLRIYSSDNLLEWECESTYAWLHTECPDLYPIETSEGTVKWVLSRGGRAYKVGDFEEVDGNWTFVPDAAYEGNKDGIMNFGKDSYAAMTYYVQDFGTADDPTIPEIVEINWMNTWDDYCNLVANAVGQDFNGTFNLNLTLGLVEENGKYVLTQTPIKGYEDLRTTSTVLTDVTVEEENNLFADFVGDSYEIKATFTPADGTDKVGFKVRVGENQETLVYYDFNTGRVYIDRSKGNDYNISGKFLEVVSQSVSTNDDGSVDLHIFVDKSSVEVFTKDYTVAGAQQIFPAPNSRGLEVFVEGEAAKADIAVYQLESAWEKEEVTTPISVEAASKDTVSIAIDKTATLSTYVLPIDGCQDVEWSIVSGSEFVSVEEVDGELVVTGKAIGTATIKATSTENKNAYKVFTVNVHNFNTNIDEWTNAGGDWTITGETLSDRNTSRNDYYMSTEKLDVTDFVLETDLAFEKGLINLFVASPDHGNGQAYSVQFDNNGLVRLFYFAGNTIKETRIADYNNNGFFHVTIEKSGKTMRVYVEDKLALEHTFNSVRDFYSNPSYVGVGLWDGDVSVQNFFVYDTTMITDHYAVFEGLNPEDYTEASYNAYKAAVDKAKEGITALNIAELYEELEAAYAGLKDALNLDELEEVIDDYLAKNPEDYTEESVQKVEDVVAKIQEALYNDETTQKELDALVEELKAAIDALVEKGSIEDDTTGPGTGDTTNVAGLLAMLLLSFGAIVLGKRRKA